MHGSSRQHERYHHGLTKSLSNPWWSWQHHRLWSSVPNIREPRSHLVSICHTFTLKPSATLSSCNRRPNRSGISGRYCCGWSHVLYRRRILPKYHPIQSKTHHGSDSDSNTVILCHAMRYPRVWFGPGDGSLVGRHLLLPTNLSNGVPKFPGMLLRLRGWVPLPFGWQIWRSEWVSFLGQFLVVGGWDDKFDCGWLLWPFG